MKTKSQKLSTMAFIVLTLTGFVSAASAEDAAAPEAAQNQTAPAPSDSQADGHKDHQKKTKHRKRQRRAERETLRGRGHDRHDH